MQKGTHIQNTLVVRPPIVTILGHVDHGKTTLLDAIRKTNIAASESGGITQHIGAYQITTKASEKQSEQEITFIDTPGHQAFSKMRSRGADVADIAILVIAANDGVMPQTVESLSMIQTAKIPYIIALNKTDLPDINVGKIKQQLTKLGVQLEEFGGDVPTIELSAKKGQGIEKLLSTILLLSELAQIREDQPGVLRGVVIESTLSKTQGAMATVVIRSGSIRIGDELICGASEFKVRALRNWQGQSLHEAKAGTPVEILGWNQVPPVGSVLYKKNQRELPEFHPINTEKLTPPISSTHPLEVSQDTSIKFIIKADTAGTLEAIVTALKDKKDIITISATVGAISESDVLFAKTTGAIIIGFHTKIPESVSKLATSEKVIIKTYTIIYELLDEMDEVIEAIKKGNLVTVLGEARVQALFPIKENVIAGIKVISGRIARGDQIKLVRGEKEVGRSKIKSLRHGKEDITVADQGKEAGLILSQSLEILTGDSIISIG
ncbi:translation initiation factor IF-2 [Candidatus Gottesmanbacteria bacterium]|nr:translation initiation factor IF-2 [Candidatus Gottesmanbacteria bacterium]